MHVMFPAFPVGPRIRQREGNQAKVKKHEKAIVKLTKTENLVNDIRVVKYVKTVQRIVVIAPLMILIPSSSRDSLTLFSLSICFE